MVHPSAAPIQTSRPAAPDESRAPVHLPRPALDQLQIASTTNQIEGGINSPLRDLLKRHRGLSELHQRRAMEWWLHTRCPAAGTPTGLLTETISHPVIQPEQEETDEPTNTTLYGTALTAEEGLWTRSGWIGDH